MEAKIHNEIYDVTESAKEVSNSNDPIKGNFNKIKLKLVTRAAILEVQTAYMEEEIASKKEEMKEVATEVKTADEKEFNEDINRLTKISRELTEMQGALADIKDYKAKFIDMAKKALRLPSDKLVELVATGKTTLDDKIVTKEDVSKDIDISSVVNLDSAVEKGESVLKTSSNKSIFSDIDTEEIRAQVEQVINSGEKDKDGSTVVDYINDKVNNDEEFDTAVKLLTEEVKDNIDDKKANPEVQPEDLKNVFDVEPDVEVVNEDLKSVFDVEPDVEVVNEDLKSVFDVEPDVEVVNEDTDIKNNSSVVPPIDLSNIFDDSGATFVEEDTSKDNDSYDKFMQESIESLRARLQDLKARGEELSNTNEDLDQKLSIATPEVKAAEKKVVMAAKRKKYLKACLSEMMELKDQEYKQKKEISSMEQAIARKQAELYSKNTQINDYNKKAADIEKEVEEMIAAAKTNNGQFDDMRRTR